MKTLFSAAVLAVGLALTGASFAVAQTPSVASDAGAVIEHHSTAYSIGLCGPFPCKPKPPQGR